MNKKIRSSLLGTTALAITFTSLVLASGCGQYEVDTGQKAQETSLHTDVTSSSTTPKPTTTTSTSTTTEVAETTTEAHTTTEEVVTTVESVMTTTAVQSTEYIVSEIETVEMPIETYFVYKPSTYYVHTNECRWFDNSCYEITDTNGIEARKCSECNPEIEIATEYVEPVTEPETNNNGFAGSNISFVKNFSRGTYYAYGGQMIGGSGRALIDCSYGNGIVKGSIASSYLYNNYGYNYNGNRTMVYLEVYGYSNMCGYYYLDDCDAGNSEVIDFYYDYGGNCQFQNQGVVSVDCYIVN